MSCYFLGIRSSSPGDRQFVALFPVLAWHAAFAMLLVAVSAAAQDGDQQMPAPAVQTRRVLPAGIRLNSVSLYGGSDWVQFPGGATSPLNSRDWLLAGGAAADVEWRIASRQSQFTASYHAGYNRNEQLSALNGFDHIVALDFRTDPASRTVFTFTATGQAGPLTDPLFDSSYVLGIAQRSSSIDQVADGLLRNGSGELSSTPLDLALGGIRRKAGVIYTGISRSHSRRLWSFAHVGFSRELRSYAQPELASLYPNYSVATADLGANYSLSTRTRISATGTYARSYTRLYRTDWQSVVLGIERLLGRRSFGSVQAGYARMSDSGARGAGRNSYTVSAALGTSKGYHTLAATLRRGLADLHGIGGDSTIGCEAAWSWAPHAGSWTLGSSLGYERIDSRGLGVLQAWMGQASIGRRLSAHFQLTLSTVYLRDSGADLARLERRAVRMSFVWTPGQDRLR